MNQKKYKQLRIIVALFVGTTLSLSMSLNSYLLSLISVLTGLVFMGLVRSKAKIQVDEREKVVREKAAQTTYAIFAPTIGLGSFILLMFANGNLPTVKEQFYYLESLGMVFAYLTLFLIALYAISFHFINKKYGGSSDEE